MAHSQWSGGEWSELEESEPQHVQFKNEELLTENISSSYFSRYTKQYALLGTAAAINVPTAALVGPSNRERVMP
jgi:hypothetical protein